MRAGWTILVCVLALLCVGVVMVHSAGMTVSRIPEPQPIDFSVGVSALAVPEAPAPADPTLGRALGEIAASRSAVYAALALVVLVAASLTPAWALDRLDALACVRRPVALLGVVVAVLVGVLALVYVPGLERSAKGARRWIELGLGGSGGVSFQPSELAKWVLPAVVGVYAAAAGERLGSLTRGLLPAGLAVAAVCGLIVLEDLGTAVLVAASCGVVLFAAGMRWSHIGLLACVAGAGAWQAVRTSDYRMERIASFVDPWADAADGGYHMIQSLAAIAGGELAGRGLGNGLHKLGYLPEDTTDFLFAIVAEELGVAGAAMIVGVLALLVWSCLTVAGRAGGPASRLVALGVTATLAMQAVMNLLVVVGLGPTKGIALPLVSAGGTGWVLACASLGLLVAMDRRAAARARAPERVALRGRARVPAPVEVPPPATGGTRRPHPAEVVA